MLLSRIFNLRNVNALPEGRRFVLASADFGLWQNGAGKSGYARALGSAGFARGERKVLPNATGLESRKSTQQTLKSPTLAEKGDQWTEGERCAELSGFYLFDGGSLTAHLTAPTTELHSGRPVAFNNAGRVNRLVRENVRILIESAKNPTTSGILRWRFAS